MPTLTCPQCKAADIQTVGGDRYRCARCGVQLELRLLSDADATYCSQCRVIVLSNARFCHHCGAEVQALSVTRACPICAKSIPVASLFCPYCRAHLDLPKEIGCPACGRGIAPTITLCPYCGADVEGFLAPLRLQIPIALRPCPACEQLVPVASSYCLHCRAQIILSEETGRARQWMDCPACWRTIVPENGKCPYCGIQVEQVAASPRQAGQSEPLVGGLAGEAQFALPPKSSDRFSDRFVGVAAVLVILFLCVLGLAILGLIMSRGGL